MNSEKIVKKLTYVSIFGNTILSVFKLFAGLFGNSGAMVSDAVHSLSDVLTTFIAFFGVKISSKAADDLHPYGHDRFECVAAIFLGLLLAGTGIGVGYSGLAKILAGDYNSIEIPTILPLITAVVSIVLKEAMYRYTIYYAKLMGSAAFEADAWHHRSDALSSVGSFVGILAAKLGFPIMDPIASIVICLFILKAAYDIIKNAFVRMMDTSCGVEYEKNLKSFMESQDGVVSVDLLHTRFFGNMIYVDTEISVNRDLSLVDAHNIAEDLHSKVEKNYSNIKHIMIHVNPTEK